MVFAQLATGGGISTAPGTVSKISCQAKMGGGKSSLGGISGGGIPRPPPPPPLYCIVIDQGNVQEGSKTAK